VSEEKPDLPVSNPSDDDDLTGYAPLDKQLAQGVLQGDRGTERAQVLISAFLIVAAGLLAFHPVLNIPFNGLDLLPFTASPGFETFAHWPEALHTVPEGPLTVLGIALNHVVSTPFVLYGASLFLHLLGGVALFLLARRLTPGAPEAVAMVAGLLYVCHPVAVESMTVLTQRSGVQGTALALLGTLLYLRAFSGKTLRVPSLALALILYVAATASHFSLAPLPLIWLALFWCQTTTPMTQERKVATSLGLFLMLSLISARLAAPGAVGTEHSGGLVSSLLGAAQVSAESLLRLLALQSPAPMAGDWHSPLLGGIVLVLALIGGAFLLGSRQIAGIAPLWFGLVCLSAPFLVAEERLHTGYQAMVALAAVPLLASLLLSKINQPGARAGVGVLAAVLVIGCALLSYHHASRWLDPFNLWLGVAEAREGEAQVRAWSHAGAYALHLADNAEDGEGTGIWLEQAAHPLRLAYEGAQKPADKARTAAAYGVTLARLGESVTAPTILRDALQRDPQHQESAIHLALLTEGQGLAQNDIGTLAQASEYFERALALGPVPRVVAERYGALLLNVFADFEGGIRVMAPFADTTASQNQLRQIEAIYSQIRQIEGQAAEKLSENPRDSAALLQLVEARLSQGRMQSGFYMLDRVLDREPENRDAWLLMGMLKAQMDDPAGFLSGWSAPQGLDWDGWEQLVRRTAMAGRWDHAKTYAETAIVRFEEPPFALAELILGHIAIELRQLERAESLFRASAELEPENHRPWLGLADIALVQNNEEGAAVFLREAEERGAQPEEIAGRGAPAPAPDPLPASRPGIERTVIR